MEWNWSALSSSDKSPMRFSKKFSHRSRKVFYFIHLWTGLLLGLWLVMMGLTGSILSWKAEMTEWEVRQRVSAPVPDANAAKIPVSRAIDALKAYDADLTPERGITLPASKTGYYLYSGRGKVDGERVSFIYVVNPVTAKVYPPVIKSTLWIDITEQIHHNLLVGVKGTVTNGFLTFFTLFLLISGAWLWWPSNWRQFQLRMWIKQGASLKRRLYDLHNMMGIYLFGLLFIITLTGVIICYNGQTGQSVTKGVNRLSGVPEKPRSRGGERSEPGEQNGTGKTLPIDVIVEKAKAALPWNRLVSIAAPRRPGEPFMATYDYIRITSGGVPFDSRTGQQLNSNGTAAFGRAPSPGTKVMGAVFHLHYGWFGGFWLKVLYCISGFLPLGLFITGVWMWLKKKKGQANNRARAKLRNQPPNKSDKSVDV